MSTKIRDWYIVSIFEDGTKRFMGRALYGEVIEDPTGRFQTGSYVCTSTIVRIDPETMLVYTSSGSLYQVVGTQGKQFDSWLNEIELLRNGYTPQEVVNLRQNIL